MSSPSNDEYLFSGIGKIAETPSRIELIVDEEKIKFSSPQGAVFKISSQDIECKKIKLLEGKCEFRDYENNLLFEITENHCKFTKPILDQNNQPIVTNNQTLETGVFDVVELPSTVSMTDGTPPSDGGFLFNVPSHTTPPLTAHHAGLVYQPSTHTFYLVKMDQTPQPNLNEPHNWNLPVQRSLLRLETSEIVGLLITSNQPNIQQLGTLQNLNIQTNGTISFKTGNQIDSTHNMSNFFQSLDPVVNYIKTINQTLTTTSSPTFQNINLTSINSQSINSVNWTNLNSINQSLSTTSTPSFASISTEFLRFSSSSLWPWSGSNCYLFGDSSGQTTVSVTLSQMWYTLLSSSLSITFTSLFTTNAILSTTLPPVLFNNHLINQPTFIQAGWYEVMDHNHSMLGHSISGLRAMLLWSSIPTSQRFMANNPTSQTNWNSASTSSIGNARQTNTIGATWTRTLTGRYVIVFLALQYTVNSSFSITIDGVLISGSSFSYTGKISSYTHQCLEFDTGPSGAAIAHTITITQTGGTTHLIGVASFDSGQTANPVYFIMHPPIDLDYLAPTSSTYFLNHTIYRLQITETCNKLRIAYQLPIYPIPPPPQWNKGLFYLHQNIDRMGHQVLSRHIENFLLSNYRYSPMF